MMPPGWTAAPVSRADAAVVAQIINAAQHQWGRGDQFSEEEFVSLLDSPSVTAERDGRLLRDADGHLLGGVMVVATEPWTTAHLHASMPDHPRRREGLQWCVETGLSLAAARDELELAAVVDADGVAEEDSLMAEVLGERGFAAVRRICEMTINLADAPAEESAPPLPDGVILGALPADDAGLAQVAEVNGQAFADHDGDFGMTTEDFVHFVRHTPSLRTDLSMVAVQDDRPVGLAVCMTDLADPERRTGYVGIVAVVREARSRGLARALLTESFRRFRAEGWDRARLHVQVGNRTGADRLYRSVGMRPGKVDVSWSRPLA
ncbi:MAG TPA: GNAT family N-acetyltransferase [Actinomycetes bacterium]|nr:GNAT family N-acetyltransferase [Actinomycetes bacterium]